MTTDNPEAVLEESDNSILAGSLTLFVAFLLTVAVVATSASIEFVLFTALIWILGTVMRLVEVMAG